MRHNPKNREHTEKRPYPILVITLPPISPKEGLNRTHERSKNQRPITRRDPGGNSGQPGGALWLERVGPAYKYPEFQKHSFNKIEPQISAQNTLGPKKS